MKLCSFVIEVIQRRSDSCIHGLSQQYHTIGIAMMIYFCNGLPTAKVVLFTGSMTLQIVVAIREVVNVSGTYRVKLRLDHCI